MIMRGPHNEYFLLKGGLLFHRMFALFLCFYHMFNKYEKPSLYFSYYGQFIAFKHKSPKNRVIT